MVLVRSRRGGLGGRLVRLPEFIGICGLVWVDI
jgi:hypothetical protein